MVLIKLFALTSSAKLNVSVHTHTYTHMQSPAQMCSPKALEHTLWRDWYSL